MEIKSDIAKILKKGIWLCIFNPLPCNPIDQKSPWEDKGKVEGIGKIKDVIVRNGITYIVFQVEHGWQSGVKENHYFGDPKCIPLYALEKQKHVMHSHSKVCDWYIWKFEVEEKKKSNEILFTTEQVKDFMNKATNFPYNHFPDCKTIDTKLDYYAQHYMQR